MLKFGSSIDDPLMTVMSLIDGKILKYLQDNGDRSHSKFDHSLLRMPKIIEIGKIISAENRDSKT